MHASLQDRRRSVDVFPLVFLSGTALGAEKCCVWLCSLLSEQSQQRKPATSKGMCYYKQACAHTKRIAGVGIAEHCHSQHRLHATTWNGSLFTISTASTTKTAGQRRTATDQTTIPCVAAQQHVAWWDTCCFCLRYGCVWCCDTGSGGA